MTVAEVERYAKAYRYQQEQRAREQANMVYMMPQLIAFAIGRVLSDKAPPYPKREEIFPGLFEAEDATKSQVEASRARFLKFAQQHNNRRKERSNE